jgi:hypothetical protein
LIAAAGWGWWVDVIYRSELRSATAKSQRQGTAHGAAEGGC